MFAIETCINPSIQIDRSNTIQRAQSSKRNCLRVVTVSQPKNYIKTVGEIKKTHKKNEINVNIIPIYKVIPQNC